MTSHTVFERVPMHTRSLLLVVPLVLCGSAALASPPLDVLAAPELGDELGDHPRALALDGEGNVVIVGGEGDVGTLVRLDGSGSATDEPVLVGDTLEDVAIHRGTGTIAVVGSAGLRVLGPDLGVLWQHALTPGRPHRVATGEHGTLAATSGRGLAIFSPEGQLRGQIEADAEIAGVAVLDAEGIVVTVGSMPASACGQTVEIARVDAYAHDGSLRWSEWGAPAVADCSVEMADSRGVDVARGDDGLVYVLAEVESGSDPFAFSGNIEFDATTTREHVRSSLFAYYARFDASGSRIAGQYLGFADEFSIVQPRAIAADHQGNVHVVGTTTHSLPEADEGPGEAAIVDALAQPSGFYQVTAADLRTRRAWRQFEVDDAQSEITGLALGDGSALTLARSASADAGGPTVLAWPDAPTRKVEKRPDRDDVGTFGYESGVSGADPSCYCSAPRRPTPMGWLVFVGGWLLARPRRRRR
jgi:hypothetical protein